MIDVNGEEIDNCIWMWIELNIMISSIRSPYYLVSQWFDYRLLLNVPSITYWLTAFQYKIIHVSTSSTK